MFLYIHGELKKKLHQNHLKNLSSTPKIFGVTVGLHIFQCGHESVHTCMLLNLCNTDDSADGFLFIVALRL